MAVVASPSPSAIAGGSYGGYGGAGVSPSPYGFSTQVFSPPPPPPSSPKVLYMQPQWTSDELSGMCTGFEV